MQMDYRTIAFYLMLYCVEPVWMMNLAETGKIEVQKEQQSVSDLWDLISKTIGNLEHKKVSNDELILSGKNFFELIEQVSKAHKLQSSLDFLNHIADPLQRVLESEDSSLLNAIPLNIQTSGYRHVATIDGVLYTKKGYFVILSGSIDNFIGSFVKSISQAQVHLKNEEIYDTFSYPLQIRGHQVVAYVTLQIPSGPISEKSFVFGIEGVKFVAICSDKESIVQFKLTNTIRIPLILEDKNLRVVTAYPYEATGSVVSSLNMDVDFVPTRCPYVWRFGLIFQQIKADLKGDKLLSKQLEKIRTTAQQQKMVGLDQYLFGTLQHPMIQMSPPLIIGSRPSVPTQLDFSGHQVIASIEPHFSNENAETTQHNQNSTLDTKSSSDDDLQKSEKEATEHPGEVKSNIIPVMLNENVSSDDKPAYFQEAENDAREILEGKKLYISSRLAQICSDIQMKKIILSEPYQSVIILICRVFIDNEIEKKDKRDIVKELLALCDDFSKGSVHFQEKLDLIERKTQLKENHKKLLKEAFKNIQLNPLPSQDQSTPLQFKSDPWSEVD